MGLENMKKRDNSKVEEQDLLSNKETFKISKDDIYKKILKLNNEITKKGYEKGDNEEIWKLTNEIIDAEENNIFNEEESAKIIDFLSSFNDKNRDTGIIDEIKGVLEKNDNDETKIENKLSDKEQIIEEYLGELHEKIKKLDDKILIAKEERSFLPWNRKEVRLLEKERENIILEFNNTVLDNFDTTEQEEDLDTGFFKINKESWKKTSKKWLLARGADVILSLATVGVSAYSTSIDTKKDSNSFVAKTEFVQTDKKDNFSLKDFFGNLFSSNKDEIEKSELSEFELFKKEGEIPERFMPMIEKFRKEVFLNESIDDMEKEKQLTVIIKDIADKMQGKKDDETILQLIKQIVLEFIDRAINVYDVYDEKDSSLKKYEYVRRIEEEIRSKTQELEKLEKGELSDEQREQIRDAKSYLQRGGVGNNEIMNSAISFEINKMMEDNRKNPQNLARIQALREEISKLKKK